MTIRNINIQEEQLKDICKRYLIRELAVFGSALRQDFNDKSDVDLFIEFEPESGITLFNIVDRKKSLKNYLEEMLISSLKKPYNKVVTT